jgi:hypothetical protein
LTLGPFMVVKIGITVAQSARLRISPGAWSPFLT